MFSMFYQGSTVLRFILFPQLSYLIVIPLCIKAQL